MKFGIFRIAILLMGSVFLSGARLAGGACNLTEALRQLMEFKTNVAEIKAGVDVVPRAALKTRIKRASDSDPTVLDWYVYTSDGELLVSLSVLPVRRPPHEPRTLQLSGHYFNHHNRVGLQEAYLAKVFREHARTSPHAQLRVQVDGDLLGYIKFDTTRLPIRRLLEAAGYSYSTVERRQIRDGDEVYTRYDLIFNW